jgi:DNA-binding winged helix-turn-helix (wHTH) protein
MTQNIAISDGDLDALRRVRELDAREPLDEAKRAILDHLIEAAERIIEAAEVPTSMRPGASVIRDRVAHRAGGAGICPACGGTCTRDPTRLMWNCRGCLATFIGETRLRGPRIRGQPAASPARSAALFDGEAPTTPQLGHRQGYCGELFAMDPIRSEDTPGSIRTCASLATAVVLYPLPRGGRVVFTFHEGDRAAFLPGRRFQLVWALLAPPPPHAAGELVPNADLIEQVWDDNPALGCRKDLNVLLTRCRRDLVAAGIAPGALIERAPGGGATRVRLAPGARVTVAVD